MLPHRAHEGASAQGVLQQREERGWDTLEHPRSLFPDPPLCLEPPPPGRPQLARRARKQSVHIIAAASRSCQCLKRCIAHPDTC